MLTLIRGNKNYQRLLLSQIISQLGDGITRVLLLFLIGTSTDNPLLISLVIFIQVLPATFSSLFTGAIADRYSRKRIMLYSDIYRMVIILCMIPFLYSPYILLILLGLHGIGTAFFDPARSASIPTIVGEEKMSEAVGISQSIYSAMQIIGPAIGGLILINDRFIISIIIDAMTFFLSAVLISKLEYQTTPVHTSYEPYLQSIKNGLLTVNKIPSLKFLLLILVPISLSLGILNSNLVSVLLQVIKVPATHFGFLEGILGIGAIIGSLVGVRLMKKFAPNHILLAGIFLTGIILGLILFLTHAVNQFGYTPVYSWCLLIGLLNALLTLPINSLFILTTPESYRGRASSILITSNNLSLIIGLFLGGVLSQIVGVLYGTAITGGLLLILSLILPLLKGYKTFSSKSDKEIIVDKGVES